jgi:hypothetical protein
MSDIEVTKKRPVGRPTKYKPEYCERVISLGKEGFSFAEIAADLEVDKASLFRWEEEYPEFRTALRAAKTYEQAWFEREARNNMKNRDFNANLWYRSAASRFRDDYTERKVTEVSGPEGGAIKVESAVVDARAMDPEHREALKQILLAAKKGSGE